MNYVIVEIWLGYTVARKSVQKQNTKRMLGNKSLQAIPKPKSIIHTPVLFFFLENERSKPTYICK